MLFYNHKQEFIGIDEEGLKLLNYASLEELLGVCGDVADLFAKEPGYIHNFKNFGWIDFLLHADSDARSAIVHANGRTFSCTLSVQKLFLCENPSENGYLIDMSHIKSLSGEEIKPHIVPKPSPVSTPIIPEKVLSEADITPSVLPDYTHLTPTILSEPDTLDIPTFTEEEFSYPPEPIGDLYANLALPLSEEELAQEEIVPPVSVIVPEPAEHPTPRDVRFSDAEQAFLNNLKTDKAYRFNPQIAANELGLPVDLIQEFIGDFIQQSHEFKEELFQAALKGDMNNLKILSHKLKGVAANLRIEDAFETLSIINTSDDPTEIEANLKYFYTIVDKLEGKEPQPFSEELLIALQTKDEPVPPDYSSMPAQTDGDIYEFALKQDLEKPLLVHEEELYEMPTIADEPESESVPEIFEQPAPQFSDEILPYEESIAVEEPEVTLHYNSSAMAGSLGIELPFFQELIDDYKRDALNASERITASIAAFDTHSWKKIASELKGISDNLRLVEISDELAVLSQTNDAQEAHKASKKLVGYIAQL